MRPPNLPLEDDDRAEKWQGDPAGVLPGERGRNARCFGDVVLESATRVFLHFFII